MLTCIAVDDEPFALTLLQTFIAQTPFLRLVGAYSSAVAALRALHEPGNGSAAVVVPEAPPAAPAPDAIFLRIEYQPVRVELADTLYLEGLKDYVKVFRRSETRALLSLTSLKALEGRLPGYRRGAFCGFTAPTSSI